MKRLLFLGALSMGIGSWIWLHFAAAAESPAKAPPAPPTSKYAPAEDLLAQVDFYQQHIEETLANKADFDDGAKSRLKKDANTLAALYYILGQHDSDNRYKSKRLATGLIPLSQKLADAVDFDSAAAAFAELRKLTASEVELPEGGEGKSKPVASLEQLMKQVATVNSALKRGVAPAKFQTQQSQSAGQSATLAAIAQAVMIDTHAVKNPADSDKWYKLCAEMRDSAGAANAAIHAADQAATAAAMSRMAKSCEACHSVFRKDSN